MGNQPILDRSTHQYTLDGEVIPSVTQILRALNLAPALKSEAALLAARRGQAIHEGSQAIEQGVWDPETTTPELVPYLNAWRLFLEATKASVEMSEQIVWDSHDRVAGSIDKLIRKHDERWLVEIKTGRAQPWHRLQVGCYWVLAERTGIAIDRAMIVHLNPDGEYSVREIVEYDKEASECLLKLVGYLVGTQAIRF